MKVAIIHDMLNEFGGAERVLKVFMEMYPESEVFTGFYDQEIINRYYPELNRRNLHTTFAQNTKLQFHTPLFQSLSPILWSTFSFKSFDFILSNSSYVCANLVRNQHKKHIHYIQSPPKNIFGLEPKTPLQKIFPYELYMRPYYKHAIRSTPYVIANSHHMKNILDTLFQISSTVIHCPVAVSSKSPVRTKKGDFFLCVSRLDRSKNLELPILACTRLNVSLKIVGKSNEPAYENYLRSLAGPSVEFLGVKTDEDADEMKMLYQNAKAFLFSSKCEDFGIAPVEAMGHGVPVIAYYGGGVKETIIEGQTGLFYYEHTPESLINALRYFNPKQFKTDILYRHALKFRTKLFKKKLKKYISDALK